MPKILSRGAEAIIRLHDGIVSKERIAKSYRIPEIDEKLRKQRTRKEAKVLEKLSALGILCPKLVSADDKNMAIEMSYVNGKKLSQHLEKTDYLKVCRNIAKAISRIHENGIIHGDLTTSNMILADDRLHLIDFGLSYESDKAEDKAVDLHLLRQALESRHHTIWKGCFDEILKNYKDKNVLARLEKVEARGRNKAKH